MNEVGHCHRQGLLSFASFGSLEMLLFKLNDDFLTQKGEKLEVGNDVPIIGANPKLVEAVDTGASWIQPDGSGFCFPEFGPV